MGKFQKEAKGNTNHKSNKLQDGDIQGFGKKGRPKKRPTDQPQLQQITDHWFHGSRSFPIFTLLCDKGSLALRYKTGQRSNQIDETTKNKKNEETRKLKNKLKDLKRVCEYQEKVPYLIIADNVEPEIIQIENATDQDLIDDMNKICKFLDPQFISTLKLVIEFTMKMGQQDPQIITDEILKQIGLEKEKHTMLLNLALIKINIEDDLDYVLKLANAQPTAPDQTVNAQWNDDLIRKKEWLQEFIKQMVVIMQQVPQQ